MKKPLLIGLLLLAACQSPSTATPGPAATSSRSTSTPRPATATVTSIPSPPPTATPPPPYFKEEFEGLPPYWSTLYGSGESGRADIFSRSGGLRFELYDQNTWVYAVFGAHTYDAVHVEAHIENLASDVHYAGLVCFYDEQNGWIEFNMSPDGTYTLLYGQWLAEDIARYSPILDEPSLYIRTEGSSNEMGLDCYRDTVQLYFNGKLFRKMDISRFGLSRGKVGLGVASFDDLPVIVSYDWVEVSTIDPLLP
jgi:hypothetical protein